GGLHPWTPRDHGAWQQQHQVEKIVSRMQLDSTASFESLSAGLKRRVLLAQGLVCDPDILLLDEPTNHLDIEAIERLEELLLRYDGTLFFVTHDRLFLQKLATRIVELDRGRIVDWSCDYKTFQKRKETALEVEAAQWDQFDKKLAQEEAWIRHGIKARRTRNEGRVRALEKMRQSRRERRERVGSVRLRTGDGIRSGKLVIEIEGVSFGYGSNEPIIREFSTLIMRGDRVGIIGPNGSGKTTLLRLLLGELPPWRGEVRHGAHLEVAYFDQLRDQLEEDKSVLENVADGNDTILFNGKPRHIIGYLQDFLFSPDRARSPVRVLSGGERNRLLLARLFAKAFNVLVLDEPTNDLDVETLELLEEVLLHYRGTLLLVSHDRAFLNNVVTSTLAIEPGGRVTEYIGGYDDWLHQRKKAPSQKIEKSPDQRESVHPQRRQTLSFKERRELEDLPHRIEALEAEQKSLYEAMSKPAFYQQSGSEITCAGVRLKSLERELEEAYLRWET
ncbi:MAG: ATP-binding cassette domain-containing protein, partial [Syntrophobacteraceae bacterium]|nr:ATP-binding cassette domain-containing protein [Syntrophobacteraceae bacterium]